MVKQDAVSQAGAITFRSNDGEAEVLVIRSSSGRNRIFPKGSIEPGETPEAAAVRELEEEGGVTGTVVAHAGTIVLGPSRGGVEVVYYLVRAAPGPEGAGRDADAAAEAAESGRKPRWVDLDRAEKVLSHKSARLLLRDNADRIRAAL